MNISKLLEQRQELDNLNKFSVMNISNLLPIFLNGTFAEVTSDTQGSRADAFPCNVLRLTVAVLTVPLVS